LSENKNNRSKVLPGSHSLGEILSQPQCWSACLEKLQADLATQNILESFRYAREWLFVGCGSSYYIALAAAASWSSITGLRARAVPASELLLFPALVLGGSSNLAAVVISRSGRTSEGLRAAELLEREKNILTLGVTCTADQPLQNITTGTLVLLDAEEKSTVMTRSFTSMLLGLQYTAAYLAEDQRLIKNLAELAASAEPALNALRPRIQEFVDSREFADYICLGQGPFYGLACECALKLSEMSISYAQSYHTLEFRHGPKSVVAPETLITFLISDTGYAAERDVLEETKAMGGTTLTVVNKADQRIRAASDLLIELGSDLPEVARLAPYVFSGQLMGLYTGLKKGLDPDNPRNLSRVVILGEQGSEKSEHATL
jgi:glucosamine--fructose-6-phosphate aminotransferase (isomerizing)